MSAEGSQPGPLKARALALQAQMKEADEATSRALACLPERPEEALRLLEEARNKWDAYFRDQEASHHERLEQFRSLLLDASWRDHEAWLQQQVEQIPQQIEELRETALQQKISLLQFQGHAASLPGNLAEARAAYEEALSLLGDQPGVDRAGVLLSLAHVEAQAGLHREQSAVQPGETPYDRAYRECLAVEQWRMAVEARASAADWAYWQGQRSTFLLLLEEAIQLAETHELADLERKLRLRRLIYRLNSDPTGETLQRVKDEFPRLEALAAADPSELIDVLLLAAGRWMTLEEFESAEEALQEAQALARQAPAKQWSVQLDLARLSEARGNIGEAIQHAEEALRLARANGFSMKIVAALRTLIPLVATVDDATQRERVQRDMEDLRKIAAKDELALTLLQRAMVYYGQQKFELALSDCEEARQCAPLIELRRRALMAMTAALHALSRDEEALEAVLQAIALLDGPDAQETDQSLEEWRDRLEEVEVLHAVAAWLTARFGRTREAFEWAEAGKARRLRRELARIAAGDEDSAADSSRSAFDELHEWLSSEASAMVIFCMTAWGTLALVVEPRETEPLAFFVELSAGELKKLLSPPSVSERSELRRDSIFKAVPTLSEKLLHPLQGPLQEVARRCQTLYIVPDASLYRVPFAALTFADGTRLVEHMALAHVPSAAILAWCRSRRPRQAERTCLAVGVGSAKEGSAKEFSFAEQARAVAELPWTRKRFLPEATKEEFLAEAPQFTVLHLSCHGASDETVHDTLLASRIELAGGSLTPKDVFHFAGRLTADLVFLNACWSGHFRSSSRSEVDGYLRAFLHAGAASLIATLTFVHPEFAGQLALDFHQEWLKGDATKAEALRRVQRRMLQQGVEPHHWASHLLIGDHR
jgi:CHAT domain-containing protein